MTTDTPVHSVLDSSFPVLLPKDEALFMSDTDFWALVKQTIAEASHLQPDESATMTDTVDAPNSETTLPSKNKAPFIAGLEQHAAHSRTQDDLAAENKTLTANLDVTNISSKNTFVDLFYDLSENTRSEDLRKLLDAAWKADALLTLKIIFNARSIHLGKSNRVASYKAFGWLAEMHPLTLLTNLKWLVRPVIAKKAPKPKDGEDKTTITDEDFDMIGEDEADPAKSHDVRHGLSHGYYKDLLNLVVFAANDQLKVGGDPDSLLTQRPDKSRHGKRTRNWDADKAKADRLHKKAEQNRRVRDKLVADPFYRALHLTVARLFAKQLKEDKSLLDSGKKSDLKKLSLAAKWAPTFGEFHDKHTFILSSIAEILFPDPTSSCPDATNRELYLRHIREHYRKHYASPLRKALSVVERDIAGNTIPNIHYNRVPSLAMDRYTQLFLEKDTERFSSYVKDVTLGKSKISGATLLPSNLITKARILGNALRRQPESLEEAAKKAATTMVEVEILNEQWKTLVERVRAAGTMSSSIAICDVSGSMSGPKYRDGSTPMDSAIGLSILLASVTEPPFGRGFITFSQEPRYLSLDPPHPLVDNVRDMMQAPWGMNTNFIAVFEDLILPMAVENKLTQDQMVQRVFVFSDMQFDQANSAPERWTSSYQRIKAKFKEHGYEVPTLIFWNLAATSRNKPATTDDIDLVLVSGYSQGMMRALMESGALEGTEDVEVVVEGEDGMMEIKKVKKKADPLGVVKDAVSSKAYDMLEVVD